MKIWAHLVLPLFACLLPSYATPRVDVFVSGPYVTEGSSVQFLFRKTGPGIAVVPFTFSGSAVEGVDFQYKADVHSIIIPDNLQELRLLIWTFRDAPTNTEPTL